MTSSETATVSNMEAMTEQERFERFAAKLADAVLIHINTPGAKPIGFDPPCCCPLGVITIPVNGMPRPSGGWAAEACGINGSDAWSFIHGFQGSDGGLKQDHYTNLGRKYRARFL